MIDTMWYAEPPRFLIALGNVVFERSGEAVGIRLDAFAKAAKIPLADCRKTLASTHRPSEPDALLTEPDVLVLVARHGGASAGEQVAQWLGAFATVKGAGPSPAGPTGRAGSAGSATPARRREEFERERAAEKAAIVAALAKFDGNRSKALDHLGIPRKTFYRRLAEYGLEVSRRERRSLPAKVATGR